MNEMARVVHEPQQPVTPLRRIILDGHHGGTSHDTMMTLLESYAYKPIKASSDYAPPGASLERRMEGWESMPYPQPDTIQELQFAVQRDLLSAADLTTVQDAIEARQKRGIGNGPRTR